MRTNSIVLVASVSILVGCAGTAPKATFVQQPKENVRVDTNDITVINVVPSTGVMLTEAEKQRLASLIDQQISVKKALNGAGGETVNYDVDVLVTRYEKGSAVARLISAGLGQIHIDSTVRLFKTEGHELLSEFTLSKTFAWGGGYGAATHIEDVEPAFAEGIATALTGQAGSSGSNK